MARPKKQFPPKKEHRITIRMTEDMYFVVAREAERAGLSISDYFRQLVLHHKIINIFRKMEKLQLQRQKFY